jgi:hypothetical protein
LAIGLTHSASKPAKSFAVWAPPLARLKRSMACAISPP